MGRHYEHLGIKYPSVTTIISDCTNSSGALTQWAANMVVEWIRENAIALEDYEKKTYYEIGDDQLDTARFNFREVSKKALDIGSEVHNAIEMHLKGKAFKLTTKEASNAYDAFLEWENDNHLEPLELEHTVYGTRWAGTLDMICKLNNKVYVIDFKTSKSFYPEMRYQVAAYRSESGHAPEGCGVLRLDKATGFPKFHDTSRTYKKDLIVFQRMVDLYFARHPRIAKQFEDILPF